MTTHYINITLLPDPEFSHAHLLGALVAKLHRALVQGQTTDIGVSYQGVHKRPDAKEAVRWHIAMRPGKRKALDKENNPVDALIDQVEKIKASIRAKVEHPFRVIKRQFGYTKVRYRGLKKNTLQLKTLFALSNLWMVRHQLLGAQG